MNFGHDNTASSQITVNIPKHINNLQIGMDRSEQTKQIQITDHGQSVMVILMAMNLFPNIFFLFIKIYGLSWF